MAFNFRGNCQCVFHRYCQTPYLAEPLLLATWYLYLNMAAISDIFPLTLSALIPPSSYIAWVSRYSSLWIGALPNPLTCLLGYVDDMKGHRYILTFFSSLVCVYIHIPLWYWSFSSYIDHKLIEDQKHPLHCHVRGKSWHKRRTQWSVRINKRRLG